MSGRRHRQKVAVPQAQFLRPAPRRGFLSSSPVVPVSIALYKTDKARNQTHGVVCLLQKRRHAFNGKGEQADAGRDNVSTLSSPSPLITCASSVWRLLSQPSEIHSAIGRINKLSTWLIGRMQAGDAGVNIPAKPQCPAGATVRSTFARHQATAAQRCLSGCG